MTLVGKERGVRRGGLGIVNNIEEVMLRIYSAKILQGIKHPEYAIFHENMSGLGGKHPDFGGTMNGALVQHSQDLRTVRDVIITYGMTDGSDVAVSELTKASLMDEHFEYVDLVERYFLPFDDYPAIE